MFKFLMIVSTTVLSIVLSHPFNACIGKCPQSKNSFEIPTLLAHQDCTKYCFCNDGCPTVKTCPGNFHFSMDERVCLPIELAKCDDRRNCLGMCPIIYNTHNVLILPHYNSSKFCHCREWGVPTVEICPESLVFNIKYASCQKPIPDCHNVEIEAPTVFSEGGAIPPILSGALNGPILIAPEYGQTSTSADSISEEETTASVDENEVTTTIPSTEASDSDSMTLLVNNEDEVTESEEEPTTVAGDDATNEQNYPEDDSEDLTTIESNIGDAATTVYEIEVPDCENLVTDEPNYEDSTTLESKIDVIIPTVASTWESNEVETTGASKFEDPTTPKAPSNGRKIRIIPCNCTQTVFVDNNPPIAEKVQVNYLPSNVDDCIGQCPVDNDVNYTKHLPHKNCEQFCKCDWGKATVMRCPQNLHFKRDLGICDYPISANCSGIGGITTL
ncbi:Protein of unknown function [Cotesia congregata]|uniref:Chitin-binding type-2 domain-containing protein n=1 Tax=Cotesia congregata TaxID=51543 RepID=A0A8J2HIS8_COTCN|nr:Protein of unknown function [Cotesia congregata]